ncbi:MAG: PD-(D/E)XK nuclease family protein [Chthoniobacterales bacterium]|nr:PD-(D/E)XK nuclease family protein [Chthoniobacterales bacterium]
MLASSPLFFGWHRPWLPRLAQHLIAQQSNLSETVVILPGKRAGRRLLELLALQAQEQSQLLIPPVIMTLEEAVTALLEIPNTLPAAGKGISLLAWRQAALRLTLQELQEIQQVPKRVISSAKEEICYRVASLAETVSLELGKAGLSIEEVLLQHAPFFPESADREEPRWKALARLQKEYQKTLSHWCYADRLEILKRKLQQGECTTPHRILIAGVVDFSPLFVSFFQKVNPEVIIIAPEAHAAGFDCYGRVISSYWREHPAEVAEELLVPCERSRDQAAQAWKIIAAWREASPDTSITIVAPESEALPLLREAGAAAGLETRWAGGRFFHGSSLFALLEALKNFLDRAPGEPPSLAAIADLLRHPISATKLSSALEISSELLLQELDDWERDHLPLFLDQKDLALFPKRKNLSLLLVELEKKFAFALEPEPLSKILLQWRALLLHLLEQECVRRSDLEGHFFLECFEKLMLLVEELEQLSTSSDFLWRGTELLSFLLEMLSKETIPELEQPQAIEMIGWLEAAAEDTPSLVLTSFHEGAVPASSKNDPLLSERLRKKLGLGSSEEQLARDHYYLQLILASRQHEGGVAVLAPRYNGRGEPVRPSRLLLQGCSAAALPHRVLALTQADSRQVNAALQQVTGCRLQVTGPQDDKYIFNHVQLSNSDSHADRNEQRTTTDDSFLLRPATCNLQPVTCNVTALRTYLKSPRLFYLQHVLKLQEVLETPSEMTPSQFGVLIHRILGAFSAEASLQEEKKESVFSSWLEQALERSFQWQFGWNPAPAVASQQGELLRALKGFARAEAAHRSEGWITIAAEGKSDSPSLVEELIHLEDGRSLLLQGRIDRLDWHPEKKRWLLLDYKTSHRQEWKKETPNRTHFKSQKEIILWHDLQLPLYLKLAPQLKGARESGLPLPTIENTDLCFFQLPIHPESAGISEPFDLSMIQPAWQEAERLIKLILDGHFEELGALDATISPTWAALCGVAG